MEDNISHNLLERLERIEKKIDSKVNKYWLSLKEASYISSLSRSTINRAISKGELKVSKKTGKLLFKLDWIEKFLGE